MLARLVGLRCASGLEDQDNVIECLVQGEVCDEVSDSNQ